MNARRGATYRRVKRLSGGPWAFAGTVLLTQCASPHSQGTAPGDLPGAARESLNAKGGGTAFSIVARHSGKCLAVDDVTNDVLQTTCDETAGQSWRLQSLGAGYFYLLNAASGKVVDVDSFQTADGTKVDQYFNLGTSNQQFQLVSTTSGWFNIVGLGSGKPIEVAGGRQDDGAKVDLATANGRPYQEWSIQPVSGKIINRNDGKTVRVQGASGAILATYANTAAEHWTWTPTSDGYYRVMSQSTGQVLEATNCFSKNGSPVGVWGWLDNACQQWRLMPTSDGYFQMINRNSGKALDAAGCGATLDQYVWLDNDCQRFRFEPPGYDWVPSTDTLVHDPSVIQVGSAYYMGTTGGTITLSKSTDRVSWTNIGTAFAAVPPWVATELRTTITSLWAPDISFFGGKYHLYYAASVFGTNNSAIGVASSPTLDPSSPSYAWTDDGLVLKTTKSDDYNAIDPSIAFDDANVPWITFGSFWSGIKMRRIDPATGKLSAADPTLYSLASRGGGAVEAPSILRANGFYYLFVSYDACCRNADSTYRTMVGRATSITGPYEDSAGNPMNAGYANQMLAGIDHWRGPGGGSVYMDGATPYFAHHYYDSLDYGNSKLQIREITFDAQYWPIMGAPLP